MLINKLSFVYLFVIAIICPASTGWAQSAPEDIFASDEPLPTSADRPFPSSRIVEKVLTDTLTYEALLQAPPPPTDGYAALGRERPIFSREDYAHPSAFTEYRCDPAETKCIKYNRSRKVRPMLGNAGWCNAPFVNMAVEVSNVRAPGRSSNILIEAHSNADRNAFTIGHLEWRYIAEAVALACPDAYIAVQDVYWTGFQHPLYRVVFHLGNGQHRREEHPGCWERDEKWNEDRVKRACLERFFDGFGRANPPVKFAELEALYASPPSEAERKEILAALAPTPEASAPANNSAPEWTAFDEPDRSGLAYTGWTGERIEIGCAGEGFGFMSGRPYMMMSVPAERTTPFRLFAYAIPETIPNKARINFRFEGGSGQGTPMLEGGFSGGIETETGRRFAALIPLNDPAVGRTLRSVMNQGRPIETISLTFFPPEGDGIAGVRTELPLDIADFQYIISECGQ